MAHTADFIVRKVQAAKALKAEAERLESEAKLLVLAENETTGITHWATADGSVNLSAVAGKTTLDRAKVAELLTPEQLESCLTHSAPTLQVRFTPAVQMPASRGKKAA